MAPKKRFITYSIPSSFSSSNTVSEKIKCSRCNLVKGSAAFSNRRLNEIVPYLRDPKFNSTVQAVIPCISCSGGQRLEHTCSDCGKTKATDTGFSKTQLKKGDDALCIRCSDKLNGLGVGGVELSEDEDDEDDTSEGEDSPSEWDEVGSTMVSGVALRSSAGTTVRASSLPSGFDPTAYSKPKTAGSVSTQSGNPGFAKIRSVKPRPMKKKQSKDEDEDDIAIHSDGSNF